MTHDINDDDEKAVSLVLQRAIKLAAELFKSTDPLLIMEIHDRMIARAHCCRLTEEVDDDDEKKNWR
jgi:hypothetical protein